jgi:hypothetical protein
LFVETLMNGRMYYTAQMRGCVLVKTLNSPNQATAAFKACEYLNDLLRYQAIQLEGLTLNKMLEELIEFDVSIEEHKDFLSELKIVL